MATKESTLQTTSHPLEPLTGEEIKKAVAILREKKNLGSKFRFEQVGLNEPAKEVVLNYKEGDPVVREAFIVLIDKEANKAYESVVSLTEEDVISWEYIPGVQPSFVLDEYAELEATVKKHPDFHTALLKRGVQDPDLVMVDPWSAGHFGIEEDEGRRIGRALCFAKKYEKDNGYAYPLTGLIPVVDLNTMEVIRIEDHGVKPLHTHQHYVPEEADVTIRDDVKPLNIVQPDGPSFEINGHHIKWLDWSLRVGYTAREGLVIHNVTYTDKGEERPVLYRAALSEMVVPYGDTSPAHNWQNAFDAGEYGLGQLANSLTRGCDCLGEIRYFDAVMADGDGDLHIVPNAVCLHEEDYGIAWKHTDWRTEEVEVRRQRRLVVSFFTTVANYDYGFYWYFYPDGKIDHEVKLTGILNVSSMEKGEKPKYGTEVAPGINAPIHQHFFNYRIDMQVDGQQNSVVELNSAASPKGPNNPNNNGFYFEETTLKTELEAKRNMNLESARSWKIVNPNKKNYVGDPVAYMLEPGKNCSPFAGNDASVLRRAGFIKHHLHVTKFDRDEMYSSGKYPNQRKGGSDGLEAYANANRSIENEDVVVWYTLGLHHICRPEDWPVMPTEYMSFTLKPHGFFDGNPALDLPRPSEQKGSSCH